MCVISMSVIWAKKDKCSTVLTLVALSPVIQRLQALGARVVHVRLTAVLRVFDEGIEDPVNDSEAIRGIVASPLASSL